MQARPLWICSTSTSMDRRAIHAYRDPRAVHGRASGGTCHNVVCTRGLGGMLPNIVKRTIEHASRGRLQPHGPFLALTASDLRNITAGQRRFLVPKRELNRWLREFPCLKLTTRDTCQKPRDSGVI